MAESLPPESDHKDPSIDDEELVQIGVHGAIFPPPEQEPSAADITAGASSPDRESEAKLLERDDMHASQVEETSATGTDPSQTTGSEESATSQSPKRESCLIGCLHDVLLVVISALLGGALVLGALLFLNGTLDMRSHDSIVSLNSRAETLSADLSSLNERVNSNTDVTEALGENLSDTNEQLAGVNEQVQTGWSRFQDLDNQVQTLDAQVQVVDAHVQTLDGQVQDLDRRTQMLDIKITTVHEEVIVLNQEVAKLSLRTDKTEAEIAGINQQMVGINQSAERFDIFADGLRALADSLARPSATAPEADLSSTEADLSPTEPISNTEPVTVSITITTTETIADSIAVAEPITPTVSLPLVANRVDADAADTEGDETPVPPSIDDNPNLTLFPPLLPIPELSAGQSHIFGLVWDDLNSNGQPEEGEVPIPAATIILRDARGNVLVTTVTDSAGRYIFANIAPGVYIVEETDPADVVSISSNLVTITVPVGSVIETNFADQF